jgi:DNA-directed RNA polymerase specialized sigma subunit
MIMALFTLLKMILIIKSIKEFIMKNIILYQQTQSPELGKSLLQEHKDIIDHHVKKWSGILPDVIIQKHANAYALDAFKTFDPNKGASLNTHMYNHLSKLSRLNYENQNVVKIPEHQILQIRNFNDTVAHLKDKFNREPTYEEIADHMVIPVAHVKKIALNSGRKDFTYDSDHEDIQQGDIEANPQTLYLQDTFSRLPKDQQQQFQDLTGYNGATVLKPSEFGKKYKMKPYEVSRVKTSLAKRFK